MRIFYFRIPEKLDLHLNIVRKDEKNRFVDCISHWISWIKKVYSSISFVFCLRETEGMWFGTEGGGGSVNELKKKK